ncbi:MAG: hypothetical protein Q8868_04380 [Bacteroidota bacterium]|nr:hypothetical protein [Bacteroidota bacterium]
MNLKKRSSLTSLVVLLILTGLALLSSCEKYAAIIPEVNSADTVHFKSQIQPIFTANCITCHNGSRNPDLREGYSYASLRTGFYVNLPAENSRLYKQITSSSHYSFTLPAEKQLILTWIQQGAGNN